MALAWNEIKDRALAFSREWARAESEDADAKPFWIEFFNVFGITSRRIGSFEQKVKKLGDRDGYIDWLWKGNLLIEHKSRGRDLDRAYQQAIDYFPGLKEHELPRFVLVSDFARFRLYDMAEGTQTAVSAQRTVQKRQTVLVHRRLSAAKNFTGKPGQRQSGAAYGKAARPVKTDRLWQGKTARPGNLSGAPAVLPVCRGHRHFRAHAVHRIHRSANPRRRQRPGVAIGAIVRHSEHTGTCAAEKP